MSDITIKLQIKGGSATPAPPIGTALGPRGINAHEFCQQFNKITQDQKGKLLRVVVILHPDKTFKIIIKGPPLAMRIKEEAGVEKGSSQPKRAIVGKLTQVSVDKILEEMQGSIKAFTTKAKISVIVGTARSMGIQIIQ